VQYEYKTVVLSGGFVGLHKEELDRADLDRQLGELGAEGWDLCWALMDQTLRIENDGHVLVFKRLVEEEFEQVEEEETVDDEPADDEPADEAPVDEAPVDEEPVDEEPAAAKNLPRKSPPTRRPHNCVECGKSLREGARFCGVCGTQVDA
jgi:zinc-ribbon domain